MREVYEKFLHALLEVANCQKQFDCSSLRYQRAREAVDKLSPELTPGEREDAYKFSVSLDSSSV